MYYSKSTGGFYLQEIHGDNIPADAVEITQDQHQALIDGQSAGKVITADNAGFPVLQDPPPPPPPSEVTMRQARLALLAAGKLGDVAAALASITDPVQRQAAQIEWEYSSSVKRDSDWVQQLAPALGLDAAGLGALFTAAAAL